MALGDRRRIGPPSRVVRNLVIALLVVDTLGDWLGDLLLPALVRDHPVILLAISHRPRTLLLVSPRVGPLAYAVVGGLRQYAPHPLYFLLGRWYGRRVVAWMEGRSERTGRVLRRLEGPITRAPLVAAAIAPLSFVCVVAGAAGTGTVGFTIASAIGTALLLVCIRVLGRSLGPTLLDVGTWLANHPVPVVAVVAVAAVVGVVTARQRSRQGDLAALLHPEGPVGTTSDHPNG